MPVSVTSDASASSFNIRFINTQTNELYSVNLSFGSDFCCCTNGICCNENRNCISWGDKLFTGYIGVGSGLSIEKISLGEFYNTWSIITNKYVTGPTSIASYAVINKMNHLRYFYIHFRNVNYTYNTQGNRLVCYFEV